MRYFKAASYIFLFAIVIGLSYMGIKAQQDLNNSIVTQESETPSVGLVSIPVKEDNLIYKGEIKLLLNQPFQYSLINGEQTKLYLKSANQDLSLLVGTSVEVVGDIQGNYQGIAIMDVKSIKLK